MRVKLLGYQKVDFKDDSGSGIRGTSIFISYTENGVQGEKAEKKFLPDGFEHSILGTSWIWIATLEGRS